MPNLPIRGLGSVGVVTDVDPYNLPINGFTRGKNIRFHEGKVSHGPVFRDVAAGNQLTNPVFVHGVQAATGYDTVLVVTDQFAIEEFSNGVFTQRHNAASQLNTTEITATTLANVTYVNRSDRIPVHRTSSTSAFTDLPNWPTTLRATSLRSFGDFLVAMNTTENGVEHPNRVRFSTTALSNNVPSTWDETDVTQSAGFNDLVQMETPILDGATLGSNFLVYSSDQVWLMEFVGGTFIFNFRKLFDDAGVMSQNCIVEVEGKHFVFDFDDIYMTDGNTRQSICDGRVRDYIFNSIDYNKRGEAFVLHNANLEEIYFCYHSGDDLALVQDGDKCNRAAVYNYKEDTWSFYDLPNVVGGSVANISSVQSFATVPTTLTYANAGGSYLSQESEFKRQALMVSKQTTTDVSYTVTVAAKADGSGNAYFLDGVEAPALTLFRGQTYNFDISDATNALHPLVFAESDGTLYSSGVSQTGVNGVAGGMATFTVPIDAPASLQYKCNSHANMGNTITSTDGLVGVPFSTIYGVDLPDVGSLTQPTDIIVSKPALLERSGIDLDDQGIEISGYKVINTFYPQMATANLDGNFTFHFGAADIPTATSVYEPAITFDVYNSYKVDTRISGRYLSYKVAAPTLKDFSFSGMDINVIVTGRR